MSDKAKRSHIENLVYVAPTVKPGDSIRYGDWEENEHAAKRCVECYGSGAVRDNSWRDVRCDVCRGSGRVEPLPLTIIELATGSDYSGTLVEKSNARVLKRDFPWLVEIYGSHGTEGLGYLGKRENQNDALIEAIDALTDYPLLDESDHSELEQEAVDEAWTESYGGRHDWKRALVEYFNAQDEDYEHDEDLLDDSAVDALWWDCTERFCGGESHINETGDSIYFPIGRVIECIERNRPGLDAPHYSGERPTIREQLDALAQACRVIDVPEADLLVARDAFFSGRDEWRTIVDERWHVALIERWESENNQPTEQP